MFWLHTKSEVFIPLLYMNMSGLCLYQSNMYILNYQSRHLYFHMDGREKKTLPLTMLVKVNVSYFSYCLLLKLS